MALLLVAAGVAGYLVFVWRQPAAPARTANAAGVAIEAEVANYFKLTGGKITFMQNFHDTRPFDPFVNQKLD